MHCVTHLDFQKKFKSVIVLVSTVILENGSLLYLSLWVRLVLEGIMLSLVQGQNPAQQRVKNRCFKDIVNKNRHSHRPRIPLAARGPLIGPSPQLLRLSFFY